MAGQHRPQPPKNNAAGAISSASAGTSSRPILHTLAAHLKDRQRPALGPFKLLDAEFAGHSHGPNRKIRAFTRGHFHQDAIKQRCAGAEAALLVIAHEHERREPLLSRRQNIPANADCFASEVFNLFSEHVVGEIAIGLDVELQIIESLVE